MKILIIKTSNNSSSHATVYDYGNQLTISAGNITNFRTHYALELSVIPESKDEVIISDDAVISSMNLKK